MRAFELEMTFVTPAEDLDAAMALWDEVERFAADAGLICEGGRVGAMKPGDVVPGSPLAQRFAPSSRAA